MSFKIRRFKTPVVESGGSSIGKKGVCEGIGTEFIDFGNASSRMKEKELAFCDQNGVDLTEIKVGYDGIVVANSKKGTHLKISRHDLGMALTAEVPDPQYPESSGLFKVATAGPKTPTKTARQQVNGDAWAAASHLSKQEVQFPIHPC